MKSIIKKVLLIAASALALGGCGGGGDSTTTTYPAPTPTPTPTQSISLVPFKAVYGGTATAGTKYSFNLSGTDKSGKAYTATYTLTSKGATVFEGQNVNQAQEQFSLSTGGQSVVQETGDIYWTTPNSRVYKALISSGDGVVVGGPGFSVSADSIPDNNVEIANGSTGTQHRNINGVAVSTLESIYYCYRGACIPDINGNLYFKSKYAIGSTTHEKTMGFYLKPEGTPYKMALKVLYNGAEITMNSI